MSVETAQRCVVIVPVAPGDLMMTSQGVVEMSEALQIDLLRIAREEADENGEFNLHTAMSHFGSSTKQQTLTSWVAALLDRGDFYKVDQKWFVTRPRGSQGARLMKNYSWIGDDCPPQWKRVGTIDVADPADLVTARDRGYRIGTIYDGLSGSVAEPCAADTYKRRNEDAACN